jgi:hypothetical protein
MSRIWHDNNESCFVVIRFGIPRPIPRQKKANRHDDCTNHGKLVIGGINTWIEHCDDDHKPQQYAEQ